MTAIRARRLAMAAIALFSASRADGEPTPAIAPATTRFADPHVAETPDFRRHVVPLLGRLGCNGRSCHGSFQGQGGFRLSLFGYDLDADHQALLGGDEPRTNIARPTDSLILHKPTHADEHGGGKRMDAGDWSYNLLRRWVEADAAAEKPDAARLASLEVEPREVVFADAGERRPLRVLAHWSDGTVEDVTPLCRYQTNDDAIAVVDEEGVVAAGDRGDTHIVAFYDTGVATVPVLRPLSDLVGPRYPEVAEPTKIDALVTAKLRTLGIVPSVVCTDGEFLRRVSLDLTGTLPTPREIETFTADGSPDKRAKKIDELLDRPAYVARWTTKLCDITGNSPRHFQDQAPPEEYARNWYEWIARRVRENVPYDEIAAGILLGRSRLPGESYEQYAAAESAYYRSKDPADFTARDDMPYFWAKQTLRLPEERAMNVSYAFLGVRIECAQCHKHPFDRWTQADFKGFTALFDRIGFGIPPADTKSHKQWLDKLADKGNQAQRVRARLTRAQSGEIVPWEEVYLAEPGMRVEKGRAAKAADAVAPRVLGGDEVRLAPSDDPRQALVEWLRRKDNPYFARVFVNRVWAEYFGIGIIQPADDMNLANPPSNRPLLDYLADDFVAHKFDMKWLHREIVNSATYQRSAASNDTNRLDERNFSRAVVRRLPADVLFDAVTQATAADADLARAAIDVEERAIGPKGGAYVGRYKDGNYAATVFGRSPRDTNCDCSASNEPNLLQAIYLQNDKDVTAALLRKDGRLVELAPRLLKPGEKGYDDQARDIVREAYLRTLSREPTTAENQRCTAHLAAIADPREGFAELYWALLNAREFVTNH